MGHIHTGDYYSVININKIVPSAETWMDQETVTQSEVSQKEKQISYINAYMSNLGKQHTSLFIFLKWQSQNLNQTDISWAQDLTDLIVSNNRPNSLQRFWLSLHLLFCITYEWRLQVECNSSISKEVPRKTARPVFLHWRTSTLQI